MGRPRKPRHICFCPRVYYFKPRGIPLRFLQEIILQTDEVEALRLKHEQGLDQTAGAKKMGISQPCFHRMVSSAHKKIAHAIIHGQALRIEKK